MALKINEDKFKKAVLPKEIASTDEAREGFELSGTRWANSIKTALQ